MGCQAQKTCKLLTELRIRQWDPERVLWCVDALGYKIFSQETFDGKMEAVVESI